MELQRYVRLFVRWSWLIVLAAVIGGAISYYVSTDPFTVYESETTITIGNVINDPNPNAQEMSLGRQLAETYTYHIQTQDMLNNTIVALDLPLTPETMRERIETRTVTGTALMVIVARDPDPDIAAKMSDGLADQLILASPTNLSESEQQQIDVAHEQIDAIQIELQDLRDRRETLDELIVSTRDSDEIARLSVQRDLLVDQINVATSNIAQFTNSIVAIENRTNELSIVEHARTTKLEIGLSRSNSAILGALVGIALAIAGILIMEYLDKTIKSTDDAARELNIPVLGAVTRFGRRRDDYPDRLIVKNPALAEQLESYRSIRMNLLLSRNESSNGIYVVTSAGPGEGKSVTSANLATAISLSGLRVLLIDADIRNPTLHKIFELENEEGLSTLITLDPDDLGDIDSDSDDEAPLPEALKALVHAASLPGFWVMPAGQLRSRKSGPQGLAELSEILTDQRGSARLRKWIEIIRKVYDIDIVLLDTPPTLLVADSIMLGVSLEAEVVLVVDGKNTRREAAKKTTMQFEQLGIEIKGMVMNRANVHEESYYYKMPKNYYLSNGLSHQEKETDQKHRDELEQTSLSQ